MDIKTLNIIFEDGSGVSFSKDEFSDFYIANVKDDGEEVAYEQTCIKGKFYANLCLLKLNKELVDNYKKMRIKSKKDIVEVQILFDDMRFFKFDVASNANPFDDVYSNDLEYIYEDDNSLGILLSEFDIKYKNNLFA